jgi:hypothetical protein
MTTTKKPFDIVKKPFDPNLVGEWLGDYHITHTFYLTYIKKNFRKQLHFLPFVNLRLHDNYRDNRPEQYIGNFLIEDRNNNKYIFLNDSRMQKYVTLYKNTKKRFTYFPISITIVTKNIFGTIETSGHAVSAIYDKKTNEVEFFDSNPFTIKKHDTELSLFFKQIYGKDIKIVYLTKCFLFSEIDIYRCNLMPYKYTSKGFCVIWVLWYLELRLKNRELSREQIIDKAENILKNGSPKDGTRVCELLRGYAQFVNKTVDKYIVVNKNGKNTLKPNPTPKVFANSVPTTNFNIKPESIKSDKDYLIALGLLSAIIGTTAAVIALKKYYNKRKNKKI